MQVKKKYPFNPDTYLGHRGPDELINVTGMVLLRVCMAEHVQHA